MDTSLTFLAALTIFVSIQYNVDAWAPVKVINGTTADDGEFPYIVQLRGPKGIFFCGGAIIGPKWILTAGACISSLAELETIVYGTNKLYSGHDGYPDTSIKVKQMYQHPDMSYDFLDVPLYDVGLVELESPIPYSATAQPIQLAEADASVPFHVEGVFSGWGVNETWGDYSPTLQKINLPLLSDDECTKKINDYTGVDTFKPIHHLCTDDYHNGECFGDVGAPYVINNTQYGIVSFSFKPCGIVPGVYSRITNPKYRNWIKSIANI